MTTTETNVPRCRYYIDENHKKVVCVLLETRDAVTDYIYKNDFDNFFNLDWNTREMLMMPASFSGVATCNENDEFDVEFGKKLAYNKAKLKFNNSFFKRMQKYSNLIDRHYSDMINRVNAYGAKLTKNQEKREKVIEDYLNGNK